jgi:hypothetical protein
LIWIAYYKYRQHCSGWTGYTWNKQLFPNQNSFNNSTSKCLKTALEFASREGIHPHKKLPTMRSAMGIDPASKTPVPFDPLSETSAELTLKYRITL